MLDDLLMFMPFIMLMFFALTDAFSDKKKDHSKILKSIEKKQDRIIELLEKDKSA